MSRSAFLARSSSARAALFSVGLVMIAAGCRPKIGDSCTSSIDCSQTGSRLCDTSQPEGYCTIFNCEPDKCPNKSVCVGFGAATDPRCGDTYDPRWSRFERTFCMAACDTDSDCRQPDYQCLLPPARRAVSIDVTSEWQDSKVCFPAISNIGGGAPGKPLLASIEPAPACFDATVAASVGSGPPTSSSTTGSGGAGGAGSSASGAGGSASSSSSSASGTASSSASGAGGAGGAGGN